MKKVLLENKWLVAGVLLLAVAVCFSVWNHRRTEKVTMNTNAAVTNAELVVRSQDKVVEHIYTTVVKEVRMRDAEIKQAVKALSPDSVAVSLDALVKEYRRERNNANAGS